MVSPRLSPVATIFQRATRDDSTRQATNDERRHDERRHDDGMTNVRRTYERGNVRTYERVSARAPGRGERTLIKQKEKAEYTAREAREVRDVLRVRREEGPREPAAARESRAYAVIVFLRERALSLSPRWSLSDSGTTPSASLWEYNGPHRNKGCPTSSLSRASLEALKFA